MKRIFGLVLRFSVVPVLLWLSVITGGVDGFVGWFVLAWMLWRGGPAMWGDVKNACRWFFGFRRRFSFSGRGRRVASELNL